MIRYRRPAMCRAARIAPGEYMAVISTQLDVTDASHLALIKHGLLFINKHVASHYARSPFRREVSLISARDSHNQPRNLITNVRASAITSAAAHRLSINITAPADEARASIRDGAPATSRTWRCRRYEVSDRTRP